MTQILTEKYRPKSVDDLVFINDDYELKFKQWVKNKTIDSHLLFYGPPGTGKSSSINVLINELNLTDYIRYNMSDKTSIDDMRKVIEFASSTPINNNIKIVILEEFERASAQAQDSLKYVLEQYAGWCRFIFTTNNISKITPAIISRCQKFYFNTLKFQEFVTRIVNILTFENIKYHNLDVIVDYVKTYYPDLRACINAIDQNCIDNILNPLQNNSYVFDKFNNIITNIKTFDTLKMKQTLSQNIANEEYELLYQHLYNNLELITPNTLLYDKILVIIAKYLYQHNFVAYPDINFISCIIEIKEILK